MMERNFNQKGNMVIILGGILVLLVLGFGGFYYFNNISKSSNQSLNKIVTTPAPRVTATVSSNPLPDQNQLNTETLIEELQGFPIYPGSILQEKKAAVPCPSEHSGFSSCDETTYTFSTTNTTAKELYEFYSVKEKNGWKMSGGAGAVEEDHQSYGTQETWRKDDYAYSLYLSAVSGKVDNYTIGIPK